MKSIRILLLLCAACAVTARALPPLPQIPDKRVSITVFGGAGDGVSDNSRAFASALAHLTAQGGGHLDVPPGVWLTGPITLESNIDLHIEEGAVVLFTPDMSAYPLFKWDTPGNPEYECVSPISAFHQNNISITGRGIINGNGQAWRPVKRSKVTDSQWTALCRSGALDDDGKTWFPNESIKRAYKHRDNLHVLFADSLDRESVWESLHDMLRPVMVSLVDCDTVLLEGVSFENSPRWNIRPQLCRDLTVRDITVRNPAYAQNGDGIDIESCTGVYVAGCTFDVGDDAICLKSGRDAEGRMRGVATSDVLIEDCKVYSGHGGFVIGSEMSGGVHDVHVRNCTFTGTDTGIKFKSTRGRGGEVHDIFIDSITMADIKGDAITLDLYYAQKNAPAEAPVNEGTPIFRDITISNITCAGAARSIWVNGLPEMPFRGLTLKNINISSAAAGIIRNAAAPAVTNVSPIPEIRITDND